MRIRSGTLFLGIFAAAVCAGPIFLLSSGLAYAYLELPHPIELPLTELPMVLAILPPAIVFGTLIGLPANAIGGGVMALLGRHFALARPRISWALAGFCIGMAIVLATGFDDAGAAFGFVFTCTASAWLTSKWVEWNREE